MASKPFDYVQATMELQQLLAAMQDGSLDVDAALKKYERGQALIAELTKYLDEAENKISVHKLG